MLHYYARHFFNQTILSPVIEGDTVTIYYIDDHVTDISPKGNRDFHDTVLRFEPLVPKVNEASTEELTLQLMMYSWAQLGNPVKTWEKTFTKPSVASEIVFESKLDTMLNQANCSSNTCFIYVIIDNPKSNSNSYPSSILFLSYFKDIYNMGLKQANVKVTSVKAIGSKMFEVDLKTDAIAAFVWLQVHGIQGYFSDNGFFMLQANIAISFYSQDETSATDIERGIAVRSLMDMYVQ